MRPFYSEMWPLYGQEPRLRLRGGANDEALPSSSLRHSVWARPGHHQGAGRRRKTAATSVGPRLGPKCCCLDSLHSFHPTWKTKGLTPAPVSSETRAGPPPTPTLPSGPIEITTPPVQTGGFVGPGSYRTGLTADEGQTPLDMAGFSGTTTSPGTTTTHTIDRKRLDLGLQIINFVLEHAVLLQNLMRHIYRVIRMPIVPHKLMLPAAESLFHTITAEVPANDDDVKLRTVIRIFQSSYQPIQATKLTTVEQVCHSITGENLRWETIGNILAMASLCLIHIHGRDFTRLDPEKRSKQDLVQPFHGITDTLTTLTSESPVVNELGVALKYNQLLLALYRFGDSSMFPPVVIQPFATP